MRNAMNQFRSYKVTGFTCRTILSLGMVALVSSCMQSAHIASQKYRILTPDFQDTFDIPPPPDGSPGEKVQVWSTSYLRVEPTLDKNGAPFRDINGVPISDNVREPSWCKGAQEGSIKTTFMGEEIILAYAGYFTKKPPYYIDCDAVFKTHTDALSAYGLSYHAKTSAPFGLGINNYFLVPYRTIAVQLKDNKYLKLSQGDVIYIKDVTKITITNPYTGRKYKHDGYFFVGDVGGKVKGIHIDTFCGSKSDCLPPFTGSNDDHNVLSTAVVITDPAIKDKLKRMHLKSSYR